MTEAIGFNVVGNLMTMLAAPAFQQVCLMYGVKDEVMKLKNRLSTIRARLLDADEKKENSHLIQDWIRKLNDAVYDADDLIDKLATKALQRDGRLRSQVRHFFSSSNQVAFLYKVGHEIEAVRKKLDEIAANMSECNLAERSIVNQINGGYISHRETCSFIIESHVIGRETSKQEIIRSIMRETNNGENVSVISIVGIGGLGKTTLAQLVYNAPSVVEYFGLRSWVCVSEDFNTKSLVKKILKSIATIDGVDSLELEQLQRHLRDKLNQNKYLLVLDDVWNEDPEEWELIRKFLMGGSKGSKILVTTRSERVASVLEVGSAPCTYTLKGLNEDQSWTLFEKIAFRGPETVNPKLIEIGKEIIKRCHGVPLGIRSLASVMQTKRLVSEWLYIQNSGNWSSSINNDIITILKLSYDHLPLHLKQCFTYCSIFPKDHVIEKEMLIQLWMAQGYVQSSNGSQYLEEVGNEYFMDLVAKSFFQDIVRDDLNEEVISCKMHDLIHELAMKLGSDCSIMETNNDDISARVRHVSIVTLDGPLSRGSKANGLRTILSLNENYTSNPGISNFKCLRVLDIHACGVEKVPDSICKLQHLRYLDLSRNDMTSLPNSIGNLINLQTLKLLDCHSLRTLPTSITKLISLRCLLFYGQLPNGMKNLTSLRKLSRIYLENFHLSDLNGLNELRGELSLNGLGEVRDVESESKAANLIGKQYLQSLTLNWFPWDCPPHEPAAVDDSVAIDNEVLLEGLQPYKELRVLEIGYYRGTKFPNWMMGSNIRFSLPSIVRITLDSCSQCKYLPPSLHQLQSLRFLVLKRLHKLVHVDDDDGDFMLSSPLFFPSLEQLEFDRCRDLQGWWKPTSLSQQRPSFPVLKKLTITICPKLTLMPVTPHLEELGLLNVHVDLLHQPLSPSTTPTLRVMKLSHMRDLNYLPLEIQHFSTLQVLRMSYCPSLKGLPEGLRNLSSLRSLEIHVCPLFSERCRKGTGEDWHEIAHIPNIKINGEMLQGADFEMKYIQLPYRPRQRLPPR